MVAKDDKCRLMLDNFDRKVTHALKLKRDEEIQKKLEARITDAAQLSFIASEAIRLELLDYVTKGDAEVLENKLLAIAEEALVYNEKPRGSVVS